MSYRRETPLMEIIIKGENQDRKGFWDKNNLIISLPGDFGREYLGIGEVYFYKATW